MFFGAELAWVAPAFLGHGAAAALGFGCVEGLWEGAFAILKACEAEALSCV